MIKKEQMEKLFLKRENATFWDTPKDTIIATSDKYFIPPQVLQVIDDLDNQLIGLKPVRLILQFSNRLITVIYA